MNKRPRRQERSLQGASVLVVEDDEEVLDMTTVILERAGASVTRTTAADDAIEALSTKQFSCAVIDWNLGTCNADRILATVRAGDGTLAKRTVVVTGDFLSSGEEASARRYGFRVIAKPFRPQSLIETLADLLSSMGQTGGG